MFRSLHFVPADNPRFIEKASDVGADATILDLEDAVPAGAKVEARRMLRERRLPGDRPLFIRVNPPRSPEYGADIDLVRYLRPFGVVVPKVEDPEVIAAVRRDVSNGDPPYQLMILIESFRGLDRLDAIIDGNVWGVGLGLEDFFSELTVFREQSPELVDHIRLRVVAAARARAIRSIDSVCLEFRDSDIMKKNFIQSRRLGFDGAFSLHPAQVPVINQSFSPTDEQVSWAESILKQVGPESATGYTKAGGTLITPAKVKKARLIVANSGFRPS